MRRASPSSNSALSSAFGWVSCQRAQRHRKAIMDTQSTQAEISASSPLSLVPDKRATFEIDLSLPGVQVLLLVLVEVERESRRKYGAEGLKKAS